MNITTQSTSTISAATDFQRLCDIVFMPGTASMYFKYIFNIIYYLLVCLFVYCIGFIIKKKTDMVFYIVKYDNIYTDNMILLQEAQVPQRNSASAAHMEGGWG